MAISLSAIDDFPATESDGVLTHLARPLRVTDEFPATESDGVLTHLVRPLRVTDEFPATESGGVLTHLVRPLRVTDDFPATESGGVLTHLARPLRVTDDFPATESDSILRAATSLSATDEFPATESDSILRAATSLSATDDFPATESGGVLTHLARPLRVTDDFPATESGGVLTHLARPLRVTDDFPATESGGVLTHLARPLRVTDDFPATESDSILRAATSLSATDEFPATESGGVLTHLARPLRVTDDFPATESDSILRAATSLSATDEFPATESGGVLTHLVRPLRVTDDFPATESGGVLTHLARPLRVTDEFPATESGGVLTHLVRPLRVTDDFPATESDSILRAATSLSATDEFPATESGGVLTHLVRPLRVTDDFPATESDSILRAATSLSATDEFPATESGGVLTHLARPLRVTDDFPATESGGVLTHLARPLRVTDDFPATESDGVLTHLLKPLTATDDFPATESDGVLTHFTQATPRVVPPDLFCLDIDFADTSRPASRNSKVEKIFVELIDSNASIVTEQGRLKVPNTLRPELPRGLFATPRLLEIPVVSSDDFFIQDSSTVNIRLDNADDGLSGRKYIGWYVQIWGQSLAETTRLIFNGQISEQTTNLTEVRLSMSDLVIQELEQTLPKRKITQETFPTSLAQNTPIPIVFGRAIRHKCPNLAVGYETALAAASSADATQITVNSAAGMAKGDVISIGLGTDNLETAKISAVNLSSDTATLTESLENAHAIDEVVVNHSSVYDYLLGEGTYSTIQGKRFKQVFRVYHDGRALPELVSGELTNDTNLPNGEHTLTLEDHLARPLDDWYANFVIKFYNGGVLQGAILIESYDSEMNSVTLNAVNALNYNNYRLREFRLFDGSQDYPWPGYAFMRFAVKYTGEITADVEGFPGGTPILSSNPARFIRCLLQDNTWGLGIKNDEIDTESFTAAESSMLDLKMEGVITRETTVAALVEETAKVWPLKLARDPKGISLHFREPEPAPSSGDYIAKVLPEDLTQQLELPEVVMDPLAELTKELIVNFRPDGDGKFDLSLPPADADAEEQAAESVRKMGRRVAIDLPFVYDQLTADIVLWREKQTRLAHNRRLRVSVDAAAIILSRDSIKVGEKIKVSNNILDSETDWEVARKEETCDVFLQLELVPLPDIYSQDPLDVDRLTRSLKYPYGERDFHENESSFKPPTDFSQTHPEPIRNLFAESKSVESGDEDISVCELTYEVPTENYSGAQVWLVLGNTGTPQRVTDEELVVDRLSTTSRKARFNLPLEIASYTVVVYSVSENKELLGFPVSFLVNTAPVASAGTNRSVGARAFVRLNGSGSHDPDGDPLTYSWTRLSGTLVTLNNASTARPSFTAPSTSNRHTLVFQLTVSDGNLTDTDTVTVRVAAYVPPPPPSIQISRTPSELVFVRGTSPNRFYITLSPAQSQRVDFAIERPSPTWFGYGGGRSFSPGETQKTFTVYGSITSRETWQITSDDDSSIPSIIVEATGGSSAQTPLQVPTTTVVGGKEDLAQVDDWPYVNVSFPSSYNPPTNFGSLRVDVDFQYMGQSAWVTYTSRSYGPIRALGNGLRVISVRLIPNGVPSNWLQLSLRAVVTIEVRAIPSGTTSIVRTVAT